MSLIEKNCNEEIYYEENTAKLEDKQAKLENSKSKLKNRKVLKGKKIRKMLKMP